MTLETTYKHPSSISGDYDSLGHGGRHGGGSFVKNYRRKKKKKSIHLDFFLNVFWITYAPASSTFWSTLARFS